MEERVKEVQVWLNETYGGVPGFEKAPIDGKTGWPTIYSLREGLQHELGISALGEGFGSSTKAALSNIINKIRPGYSGNIVKLIKGAFWCKGINPTDFSASYGSELTNAVKTLQSDAGITADGILTVQLMAALFDMSAFVVIHQTKKSELIRSMQQYLNSKYWQELGIMPCDGIYQRDTNTALIYALQKACGVSGANGNYGPGTIAATPTVSVGQKGEVVKIIQYGLFVNGFNKAGDFSGYYSSKIGEEVVAFRKFMKLAPETSTTADLTVIKGLLTSNGNTNRDSIALDTSKQLTDTDIANFKRYGFSVVGRYLTGSVGVGANKRPKNLTTDEIRRITNAGLAIFPIYEDGGYEVSYFNSKQGYSDAVTAIVNARNLGFPAGTTIYFAVDVDIQDGDIDGTVDPYLRAIHNVFVNCEYEAGVYGTRNVCLHGIEDGISASFVADMSYGWSGNLGFEMPENWAFDQFVEYTIGGTDIDQVAASGSDKGSKKFRLPSTSTKPISANEALDILGSLLNLTSISFNQEYPLIKTPMLEESVEFEESFTGTGGNPTFNISNGKLDGANLSGLLGPLFNNQQATVDAVFGKMGEMRLVSSISAGSLTIKTEAPVDGKVSCEIIFNIQKLENQLLTNELSIIFKFKVEPLDLVRTYPIPTTSPTPAPSPQLELEQQIMKVSVGATVAIALCNLLGFVLANIVQFLYYIFVTVVSVV
ncbi:glycoside hydrolase domain-containing protein [Lactobacillus mulieris]|uniref:glycoside hydrolase domain-containing protein n=1 Tax=Lactobacillus mulieris TaxID=2508708 RepID=UPI0036F4556D